MDDFNWDEELVTGDEWNRAHKTEVLNVIHIPRLRPDIYNETIFRDILVECFSSYLNDNEYHSISVEDLERRFKFDAESLFFDINIKISGHIIAEDLFNFINDAGEDGDIDLSNLELDLYGFYDINDFYDILSIEMGSVIANIERLPEDVENIYTNIKNPVKYIIDSNEVVKYVDALDVYGDIETNKVYFKDRLEGM
jgi:hypothetical protein